MWCFKRGTRMNHYLVISLCIIFQVMNMTAQSVNVDFSKMHFGCDGNSITAGNQWSATVVGLLGFASHHNVAIGSATWASYPDTQNYGEEGFAGISDGWQPTDDDIEIQKRHNNVAKVHIQKFITEVANGVYPPPDIFVFSLGTNDMYPGNVAAVLDTNNLKMSDRYTMAAGAFDAILAIQENYPACKVFLCTPIQSGDSLRNQFNQHKINVLRGVCEALSVEVIDCYSGCGIVAELEYPDSAGRYLRDGLHPNEEGQQLMGRYIATEIQNKYHR